MHKYQHSSLAQKQKRRLFFPRSNWKTSSSICFLITRRRFSKLPHYSTTSTSRAPSRHKTTNSTYSRPALQTRAKTTCERKNVLARLYICLALAREFQHNSRRIEYFRRREIQASSLARRAAIYFLTRRTTPAFYGLPRHTASERARELDSLWWKENNPRRRDSPVRKVESNRAYAYIGKRAKTISVVNLAAGIQKRLNLRTRVEHYIYICI